METVLAPLLARESESKSTAQPPSKEDRVKRLTPVRQLDFSVLRE